MINATPHHIGCAVKQLEESYATYAGALGLTRRTRAFDVASQRVRVCFVALGERFYLELITPLEGESGLAPFLRVGFYHLCFLVDDLAAAQAHLKARRFFALPVFESEAFAGRRCQFFLSPQKHLIELAEMSAQDFEAFFLANLRG
jgi:catechol 2,3-dioxygenase-like lactoylglutathione lyase family enzyme